jgi:hypothetical protein
MAIFHVEVHSRDRQVEHYIVPNVSDDLDAISRIIKFYNEKGQQIGFWDNQNHRVDHRIPFLIFTVEPLPDEPVIYISGEYRPAYPI